MKKFIEILICTIIANAALIILTSDVSITSVNIITFMLLGIYFYKEQDNLLYKRIYTIAGFIIGSIGIIYYHGIGGDLWMFYMVIVIYVLLLARDIFKTTAFKWLDNVDW